MVALLVIQAFQTRQLYDKKSHHFYKEVKTTLERIAVHHEKAEDVRKFFRISNTNFSGHYKDVLKEEFQQLLAFEEKIVIKDTTILEDGKSQNYLIIQGKSFDSLSGVTTQQRVLARDVRHIKELYQPGTHISKDSTDYTIRLDHNVVKKMFEKAKFVNEMMLQTFRENISDSPEERLDMLFLDSVIRTELDYDGLPLGYEFIVLDSKNKPIHATSRLKNYNEKLNINGNFRTTLFPGNLFGSKLSLVVNFPSKNTILLKEMWLPLTVNLSLVLIIIWALTFMFKTIVTQKKLAEMKNDFVSNMTHEFKTPIATISLACQAMEDPDMAKQNSAELGPYVKMINDENKRLGLLVEQILQSAQLDKNNVELHKEKVLLNEVVHELVYNAQFRIKKLGGVVTLKAPTELIYVQADRLHLSNAISNLIDNAIKYSDEEPQVQVELCQSAEGIKICVSDKGLGIKKEHLSKIFDKLYRIPTGNLHNVKGFGLGLSYVKVIARLHGWNVTVKSKVGEGSNFTLEIKK